MNSPSKSLTVFENHETTCPQKFCDSKGLVNTPTILGPIICYRLSIRKIHFYSIACLFLPGTSSSSSSPVASGAFPSTAGRASSSKASVKLTIGILTSCFALCFFENIIKESELNCNALSSSPAEQKSSTNFCCC